MPIKTMISILLSLAFTLTSIAYAQDIANAVKTDMNRASYQKNIKLDLSAWDFIPPIVAKVGDVKITKDQLITAMLERIGNLNVTSSKKQLQEIAKTVTDRMVRDIILTKLAADNGYKLTPEIEKNSTENFMKSYSDTQKATIDALMKNYGFIPDNDPKEKALRGIIANWGKDKIAPQITISDEQIKEFYEKNKDKRFKIPKIIAPSIILIKPDDKSEKAWNDVKVKAEGYMKEIQGGTDFATIAKKYTQGPAGFTGGMIGFFTKETAMKLGPEFQAACWKLADKNSSECALVKIKEGWAIAKIKVVQKEGYVPFEKANTSIKTFLRSEAIATKIRSMVDEQLKIVKPEIYLK